MNPLFERLALQVRVRRLLEQAPDQAIDIIYQALRQELTRPARVIKYRHAPSPPANTVPD